MNSANVPATYRLCRGCQSPHYWDKRTLKQVDDKKVPRPSFVEEEVCPTVRYATYAQKRSARKPTE